MVQCRDKCSIVKTENSFVEREITVIELKVGGVWYAVCLLFFVIPVKDIWNLEVGVGGIPSCAPFVYKLGGERICIWYCVCVCSLRFDQESSPENRLYLDCFCVVARGIGVSHDYITKVILASLGT